jgi:hypothetical protein
MRRILDQNKQKPDSKGLRQELRGESPAFSVL